MRKRLLFLSLKYQGNFSKIYSALKDREYVSSLQASEAEKDIKCNYITILDNEYPESLKYVSQPPIVLYYYGDISLLKKENAIAIIGSRKCSKYGINQTNSIVYQLKDKNVITVSGLAAGIDGIGHQASIDNNIKTIAVLGSGIDYCYPKTNKELYEKIKEKGLVISEYPNDISPSPEYFLIRNRIIAALSSKIVVVEAKLKSGTMNTVSYGLEMGKDIYAYPSLANSDSGTNFLIKQGAKLIECASDLFDD